MTIEMGALLERGPTAAGRVSSTGLVGPGEQRRTTSGNFLAKKTKAVPLHAIKALWEEEV
jgi:hypothetical protein